MITISEWQKSRIRFIELRDWMSENGYDEIPKLTFNSHYMKVLMHSKHESFEHLAVKTAVSKALFDRSRSFATEVSMRKNGIDYRTVDVMDMDEKNIIEIETGMSAIKSDMNMNTIEIRTDAMPAHIRIALKDLDKWAREMVP